MRKQINFISAKSRDRVQFVLSLAKAGKMIYKFYFCLFFGTWRGSLFEGGEHVMQ